ncbi:MAG: PAS domain S-box protein [Bacteroidota bacterium]
MPKPSSEGRSTATIAANDILIHLAFHNSSQANIISTVSSGQIIMANGSAARLLGYSKKALLGETTSTIFNMAEPCFKMMLIQRKSTGGAKAIVTAIKKNGKPFPCEITSAVFNDNEGIQQAITTLVDIGATILVQQHIDIKMEKAVRDRMIQLREKSAIDLKENREWVRYIAQSSYDVMWDWDILTGKIYVGESCEELLGYPIQKNSIRLACFTRCLLPGQKSGVLNKIKAALGSTKKKWNDSYLIKRHDGKIAATKSRGSIIRDKEGRAIRLIGATQDVSKLQELEKKLKDQIGISRELSELFAVANKLSYDGIWEWNLITNEFFLSEGFEKLIGYVKRHNTGDIIKDWVNYIHQDDRQSVKRQLYRTIASTHAHWAQTYRFIRIDGSVVKVFNRATIIRQSDGKACRMIGVMQDITKQKKMEEKLAQEIAMKEIQIIQAGELARDRERTDLGKELHDNVNQLLGASSLYIDMAKRDGAKNSDLYLSRSSEYTHTAIEEIRKLTRGLAGPATKKTGLCNAIENIVRDTMEVNPVKIVCSLSYCHEDKKNEKYELNLLRIVQEEINNILKHARATEVAIILMQDDQFIRLTISDNGVGFDVSESSAGIGIGNIKSRAASCNGTADFISQPGKGCVLYVKFPVESILKIADRA